MTPARVVPTEMLRWNDLKPLCESPGPCITITLPAFHQGARALPYAIQLKASARTAHEELLLKQTPLEEVERLMDPIVELEEDPEMSVGDERRGDFPLAQRLPPILSNRTSRGRTVVRAVFPRGAASRPAPRRSRLLHSRTESKTSSSAALPRWRLPGRAAPGLGAQECRRSRRFRRARSHAAQPLRIRQIQRLHVRCRVWHRFGTGKGQRTAASLLQSCGQRPIRHSSKASP